MLQKVLLTSTRSTRSQRFFVICWGGSRRIRSNAQSNWPFICDKKH